MRTTTSYGVSVVSILEKNNRIAFCDFKVWPISYTCDCDVIGDIIPDSKIHGANMGPILGRQDPGEPHVGPMNFAIWVVIPYRALSGFDSESIQVCSPYNECMK